VRLHRSVRTQRNHIASTLVSLGIHSQPQALVFAQCHGAVESRYSHLLQCKYFY